MTIVNTNGYNSNPNLRPAFYKIEYTQDMIIERIKCEEDFFYYCENYCKILSNSKFILFKPRDYQIKLAKDILENKYTIGKLPRQSGKSTIIAALISWFTIFQENYTSLIAAHVHATAIEIMSRVKDIIEHLPWWLQEGVVKWNTLSIEFENGSRVVSSATTVKTGRGFTINFCVSKNTYIDLNGNETKIGNYFDKIDHAVKEDFIFDYYNDEYLKTRYKPNVNRDRVKTPTGYQDFDGIIETSYKEVIRIVLNNGNYLECSKDHKLSDNRIVKDLNLYDQIEGHDIIEIIELGLESVYDLVNVSGGNVYYTNDIASHNCLLDEFAFVDPNIAEAFFTSIEPTLSSVENSKMAVISTPNKMNHFYKMCIDAQKGFSEFKYNEIKWSDVPGRDDKWREKTIATIGSAKFEQEYEASFLSASNTLIDGKTLTDIPHIEPENIGMNGFMKLFKLPEKDKNYFISVDPSRGVGIDSSALVIFDITQYPLEIVGHYASPTIQPVIFPSVINHLARMYNNATVLIEINDNGLQVVDTLFEEYDYDNIVGAVVKGRNGQQLTVYGANSRGLRTTAVTKRVGCTHLKNMIEMNKLIVNSFDVISELSNFELKGNSYEASTGQHDDLVMCSVNFAWATSQSFFKNYIEMGIRDIYAEQIAGMEDADMPIGYLDDGHEDSYNNFYDY